MIFHVSHSFIHRKIWTEFIKRKEEVQLMLATPFMDIDSRCGLNNVRKHNILF